MLARPPTHLGLSWLLIAAFTTSGVEAQWVVKPSGELREQTPGLKHETFESAAMKTAVGYSVVLPPGYRTGNRRYPVVYWLHGGGGNECSSVFTSKVWRNLYQKKRAREVILVYPNGFRSGYMDHIDGKVMIETMIIRELKLVADASHSLAALVEAEGSYAALFQDEAFKRK